MPGTGDTPPVFEIVGVKPDFNSHQEDAEEFVKRNAVVHASPCDQILECPFRRKAHDV